MVGSAPRRVQTGHRASFSSGRLVSSEAACLPALRPLQTPAGAIAPREERPAFERVDPNPAPHPVLPRIPHQGVVVPPARPLHGEPVPEVHRLPAGLGLQRLRHRHGHGDVPRRPARRPPHRAREVPGDQPSGRRPGDARARLREDVLAILRVDARALLLLRPDALGRQRPRLREPRRRPQGVRLDPALGHGRLGRGGMAAGLHPDRLGARARDGRARRVHPVAGPGALDAQDRPGDGGRDDRHVRRCRDRLARAGGVLSLAAAHAARRRARARRSRRSRRSGSWRGRACSSSSS